MAFRLRGIGTITFVSFAISWFLNILFGMEISIWTIAAVGLGLFVVLLALDCRLNKSATPTDWVKHYYSFFPCLLLCVWIYFIEAFGYFDWAVLFAHLSGAVLTPNVVFEYLTQTGLTIVIMFGFLIALAILKARGTFTKALDLSLMVFALLLNPMITQPIQAAVIPNKLADFIAAKYVKVVPELGAANGYQQPKNLVRIFIESAERTYMNTDAFGDVMDPLLKFERRGLSALDMKQVNNTFNSISGMIASECGVPFLSIKLLMASGVMDDVNGFLPSAVCLGDTLKKRGYQQGFVSGWPLEFTGQGNLFSTHGYTLMSGSSEVLAVTPGVGSSFGADDAQVLDHSYDMLRHLNASEAPFSLTIAVSGGHAPNGYFTEKCRGKTGLGSDAPKILHAVKCTNGLVAEFLDKAEREGLLHNTVIVLQSDHLTHPSTISERLNQFHRSNFFSISGPGIPVQQHVRPSSTLDILPTILEALDTPLVDGRAALGTSLFDNRITLTETVGEALFNEAIASDEVLVEKLWTQPERITVKAAERIVKP